MFTEAYRSGHNGPDSKSGSLHGLVGSNPTASANRKVLRISHGRPCFIWGISAVGSAQHWQCWGQGFESPMLHQSRTVENGRERSTPLHILRKNYLVGGFFIPQNRIPQSRTIPRSAGFFYCPEKHQLPIHPKRCGSRLKPYFFKEEIHK